MRQGRIFGNALARYVHADGQRYQSTGRVRAAEMRYDKSFPKGACLIEPAPGGRLRLISPDESECINVTPAHEGRLFKYTDSRS